MILSLDTYGNILMVVRWIITFRYVLVLLVLCTLIPKFMRMCLYYFEKLKCLFTSYYLYIVWSICAQNFYVIGRDKNRTCWRVLKIDRLEPTELNVLEDSTTYSEIECCDLLKRIHEGNMSTGGLKFVSTCYGIIGM